MRTRSVLMATTLTAVLLTSACAGSEETDTGSSGGASEAPAEGGGGTQVGVILPDTESSARYEAVDRPFLEAAFADAGITASIQNAEGDASRMQTIADQMITEGIQVLAFSNLDSESGAAIQQTATEQGVQVIDYDRPTLGGSAEYYISFDNVAVGQLQGEGLAQCLETGGVTEGNIVYLNGSPTDNNATQFAEGAHAALDPLTQYTAVAEQAVPDWDAQEATTIFEQILTETGGDVQGVLAANDGLGQAAISILEAQGLAGTVPVTGQDATVQGLQNILAGTQCMTVYKSVEQEAGALAETAIALINGEEPEAPDTFMDGDREVAAVLLEPQAIFRENVKDVVDDGGADAAELCAGEFAAACTELGIS